MIRTGLLWLSHQQRIFDFVRRNGLARKFAARFVAGETVETAIDGVRDLNRRQISATLDLLGESITQESEAIHARDIYLDMLDRIAATTVDANVSVKLTQMGFDISEDLCFANMSAILDKAKALRTFVRLDMESSAYTQRTLDFFRDRLFDRYGEHVGVVIQSCLRRSEADIDRLIAMKARVRLCKGAYLEPPEVAFPDKADVDRTYIRLMERLMEHGNYPGIATHDLKIIAHARAFAAQAEHCGGPLRVPDALRRAPRCPGRAPRRRLPHAGLRPVRYPVVSLPDAAAGGAAGEYRLHCGQRGTGRNAPVTMSEITLGGYMAKHDRAAAFSGNDGQPYSVAIYVEDEPDESGRFGASLLFVRWSGSGDRPVGHVETEILSWGSTAAEAEERVKGLSLYDVKAALDQAIAHAPGEW